MKEAAGGESELEALLDGGAVQTGVLPGPFDPHDVDHAVAAAPLRVVEDGLERGYVGAGLGDLKAEDGCEHGGAGDE